MSSDNTCPECGGATTPGEPCAACLLGVGLESMSDGRGPALSAWSPPPVEELAGKFPELELLELLGRGGMGAVYKARQATLDRLVAVKILPPEIGRNPAFTERFAREAQALARLNHPNIVTVHEFGERDGLYFFMMEFVDGVNLRQLLETGRVSSREALAIVPQICDALQCAHDQGIVHRDIKPENILMDRQGRVKIADFGLAKLIGEGGAGRVAPQGENSQEERLCTLAAVGTPAYMAPEQVAHPGEEDHRADIYALGVVFYQMLTGELPGKELDPPSRRGVQIDVRLDDIVLQALEENPVRRYSQVSVLKTRLEAMNQSAAPPPALPRTGRTSGGAQERRPWGWMVVFLVLHSFAALGNLLFFAYVLPRYVEMFKDMGVSLPTGPYMAVRGYYAIQRWAVLVVPFCALVNTAIGVLLTSARRRRLLMVWGLLVLLGLGVLVGGGVASVFFVNRTLLHTLSSGDPSRVEELEVQRDRRLSREPASLKSLPVDRVIQVGLAAPEGPWPWEELEKRVREGRVSSTQAATLMEGLTSWLTHEHPQGMNSPLTWMDRLLTTLKTQGLMTDEQAFSFLSTYHGDPKMDSLPRLREADRSLDIRCTLNGPWYREFLGLALFSDLRSITVDGRPVSLRPGDIHRNGGGLSTNLELPPLSSGVHTVECSVVSALIAAEDTLGLADNALAADWPTPRHQWVRTCKAAFRVYARDAQVVTLVDDPTLDPVLSGGLGVKALAIHTTRGGMATKATLVWDTTRALTLPVSFDVALCLDGETYSCGGMWRENGSSSSGRELSVGIPRLGPDVRTADIVLTPNPAHVDRVAEIDRIWGQEVVLRDVPLRRHDINGIETARVGRATEQPRNDGSMTPHAPEPAVSMMSAVTSPRWIVLVVLGGLLLLGFPLTVAGIIWIALGARRGLATGRAALVLALATPGVAFVLLAGLAMFGVMMNSGGPLSRKWVLLLLPAAGELLALAMGFVSRRTKSGRAAMVVAGIVLLVPFLIHLLVAVLA